MNINEDKVENTPAGGALIGKRKGQTMIHNKGSMSGYLVGKTHAEGGIKAINKSTGQPLEMQGGEVVITAPAVSDQTKHNFDGKMMTNREILSTINERGGGVAFAKDGMEIPKKIKRTGASYNYGGRTMTDHEIYKYITGGGIDNKFKYSREFSGITIYTNVEQEYVGNNYSPFDKKGSFEATITKGSLENIALESKYLKNFNFKYDVDNWNTISKKLKDKKITKLELYQVGKYVKTFELKPLNEEYINGGEFNPKPFLDYYFEEIKDFLKDQNNVVLDSDFTFRYRGEFFTIEPLIEANKDSEQKIKTAHFIILDQENEVVGEITFNPDDSKPFEAYSEYFEWNNIKFDGGGENGGAEVKVPLRIVNKVKKLSDRILEIEKMNLGNDIYSYDGDLSFKQRAKLIEEQEKLQNELTEVTDELSKEQCYSIDSESFRALNTAGDYGYEDNEYKVGGEVYRENLVKDSKSGNTPARDLNNYNDVLDVSADGEVGGENGLSFENGGRVTKAKYRILNSNGRIKYTGTEMGSWFTLEKAKELVDYSQGEMIYEYDNNGDPIWEVFATGGGVDKKEYEYVLTQRPFGIGTYPTKDFLRFEDRDFNYGVLVYSQPVPLNEIEHYSLSPITELKEYDDKILDYKIGKLNLKARVKLILDNRKGYYVNLFISDDNGILKTQPMSGVKFLEEIKNGRLVLETKVQDEPKKEDVGAKKQKSFESEGSTEGKGKLYEFFTPQVVADKMLALAQHYGFKGGNVLEPATGSGRLIKNLKDTNITAFEISKDNFEILKREFPNAKLYNYNFEKAFLKEPRFNTLLNRKGTETWLKGAPFDLVLANPPYGKFSGMYSSYFNFKGQVEHFFILQTLYLLKKGGLGVYLIPSSFLRNGVSYNNIKKQIFEIAEFVDAYRLPSNIFEKTQIGTDILILRKK